MSAASPTRPTSSAFALCARQELLLALRSRWTQVFAAIFAALAIAVAASGYVLSGGHGIQDFSRTTASLVELVLLLVPIAALVIGVLSFTPERGAAELLFAQPVSRRAVLVGQWAGLFVALMGAEAFGLGAAGLVVFSHAGGEGAFGFVILLLGSALLTAIFLALAALLAAGPPGRRAKALAQALVVWFSSVVLFDVAALGVASLLRSGAASRLLVVSVLVNPVDAMRTGSLLALQGTTAFGAASLAFLRFTKGPTGAAAMLLSSLLLWAVVPLLLAARRLRKADL